MWCISVRTSFCAFFQYLRPELLRDEELLRLEDDFECPLREELLRDDFLVAIPLVLPCRW